MPKRLPAIPFAELLADPAYLSVTSETAAAILRMSRATLDRKLHCGLIDSKKFNFRRLVILASVRIHCGAPPPAPNPFAPVIISIIDAARRLGVSVSSIYRALDTQENRAAGQTHLIKILPGGEPTRIRVADLEAFFNSLPR